MSNIASQAGRYRMENGPKSKNVKIWAQKIENGPQPEMRKNGPFGVIFLLGRFFSILGQGPFSFSWPTFPIFGFRPVFHSVPEYVV